MNAVINFLRQNTSTPQKKLLLVIEIVVFFIIYTAILVLVRRYIPDAPVLIEKLQKFYGVYGYELVFFGAMLEGTFMVGFYVPGSLIVLLGAALARSGIISFPLVVLFGTLGMCAGYTINYFLGRFGWYRILSGFGFEKGIGTAKQKLLAYQDKALLFGYIMPSTGSLLSTAAGIMKLPFGFFIVRTLLIQLFWSLLIGGLAYFFGLRFINLFINYFGFLMILVILFYVINKLGKRKLTVTHKRIS